MWGKKSLVFLSKEYQLLLKMYIHVDISPTQHILPYRIDLKYCHVAQLHVHML